MLRSFISAAVRGTRPLVAAAPQMLQPKSSLACFPILNQVLGTSSSRLFSTGLCGVVRTPTLSIQTPSASLLNRIPSVMLEQKRTSMVKYSVKNGKTRSDYRVLRRFYRLNWGMWIHVRSGRAKKLWKKRGKCKKRLQHHVMCNAHQSWNLDKMVTKWWRRERYFVDDPYTPYHKRENFWRTRKAPQPLPK